MSLKLLTHILSRYCSYTFQMKSAHPNRLSGKSFEDNVFRSDGSVNPYSIFINLSKYSTIVKRWLQFFSLSQIHIVDGDEFKEDQIKVLSRAESFLGIKHYITDDKFVFDKEKGFYCLKGKSGDPVCLGNGKGREHPTLRKANFHKLKAYFKPYNERFFRMVGKNFDW